MAVTTRAVQSATGLDILIGQRFTADCIDVVAVCPVDTDTDKGALTKDRQTDKSHRTKLT